MDKDAVTFPNEVIKANVWNIEICLVYRVSQKKTQPTCLNLLEKTRDMYMAFSSIFRKPWVLPLI